jgi:hypothetical protein
VINPVWVATTHGELVNQLNEAVNFRFAVERVSAPLSRKITPRQNLRVGRAEEHLSGRVAPVPTEKSAQALRHGFKLVLKPGSESLPKQLFALWFSQHLKARVDTRFDRAFSE